MESFLGKIFLKPAKCSPKKTRDINYSILFGCKEARVCVCCPSQLHPRAVASSPAAQSRKPYWSPSRHKTLTPANGFRLAIGSHVRQGVTEFIKGALCVRCFVAMPRYYAKRVHRLKKRYDAISKCLNCHNLIFMKNTNIWLRNNYWSNIICHDHNIDLILC